MVDRHAMLEFIAAKAEYFSGQAYASEGQKIFADFNIMGIDFIEFFKQIDRDFGVRTRALTHRVEGKKKVPVDVSIGEIVDFLCTGE